MPADNKAIKIVEAMMKADEFSRWLGIEVLEVQPGTCTLQMKIRKEMLNGFGIAHGGICYSLADSALAFASNGHGPHALSLQTDISHLKPLKEGDLIVAIARERSITNKTGLYEVIVNRRDVLVALFKGTVYRTEKQWKV